MDLSAARGDNGEIVAQWHVLDTGLKAETFKLEYQILGGDNWLPLAIDAQLQRTAKYTLIGEATWFPPRARGPIALRASASDEAGNTAVTQVQIKSERPGLGDRTAQPDRTGQADPFNSARAPRPPPAQASTSPRRRRSDRSQWHCSRAAPSPGRPTQP